MKVDLSNALEERVGEHGLSSGDLDELDEALDKVQSKLESRRSAGELGFAELLFSVDSERIQSVGNELSDEFESFVNVGIGGSALGGATLTKAIKPESNVYFPDNIDPEALSRLFERIELEQTVFNVVSKSGTTAETVSNFLVVRQILENAGLDWQDHVVVTTGKTGPLRRLAEREDLTRFEIPENVTGRYSVLSPVGLLPSAFTGVDVEAVLEGARECESGCRSNSLKQNPAYALGGFSYLLDERYDKNISVMMPYSERLELFGEWYAQLWSESLGKKEDRNGNVVHSGQTPVKTMGATDQHSQLQLLVEGPNDKFVTFVKVREKDADFEVPETDIDEYSYLAGTSLSELIDIELDATRASLVESRRPNALVELERVDEREMGELLFTYEMATAVAGELYGVNAFNQPGVESGKRATYGVLGREGYEKDAEKIESIEESLFEI